MKTKILSSIIIFSFFLPKVFSQGIELVKDINQFNGQSSSPINLHLDLNLNRLFFGATDGLSGIELYITDENRQVSIVKDIYTGAGSSIPYTFYSFNNNVFFSAETLTEGREIWITDGTETGTILFKDIKVGPDWAIAPYSDGNFEEYNGMLYFKASPNNSRDLWRTDGTSVGGNSAKLDQFFRLKVTTS